MNYQVLLEDGTGLMLSQASDFIEDGTFAKIQSNGLVSVKIGDSLISKNSLVAVMPTGEGTIDLDYELSLANGMKITKGNHNQIDLLKVDSEINKESFFEFGGGLYNRNFFKKIIPNPAKQQTA